MCSQVSHALLSAEDDLGDLEYKTNVKMNGGQKERAKHGIVIVTSGKLCIIFGINQKIKRVYNVSHCPQISDHKYRVYYEFFFYVNKEQTNLFKLCMIIKEYFLFIKVKD